MKVTLPNQRNHHFIYTELSAWISRENQLIADRMGWLVSANSFLFVPIAIMLSSGGLTDLEIYYAASLCGLGFILTFIVGSSIKTAINTISVLVQRKRYLLDHSEELQKNEVHYWIEPGRDVGVQELPPRHYNTHAYSMRLHSAMPIFLLIGWCIVSLIVGSELYTSMYAVNNPLIKYLKPAVP